MTAVGYVRKSVLRDEQRSHSPQVQEDKIRALAAAHGDPDVRIVRDLDVSGRHADGRPGYAELVEAIEDGTCSAVYALDLSRLHRNTREALAFFELCEARGVPVRLVSDAIDTSTASGRMLLTVMAAVGQMHSDLTSEKLRATFERKRANGEKLGGRFYGQGDRARERGEDAAAVVEAFRSTGSLNRAARLLNERGLPTRNEASRGWSPMAVKVVVQRLAPDLLADRRGSNPRGHRAYGEKRHALARLLRCSVCGSTLTPSVDKGKYTRYYCHQADAVPGHARRGVQERAIIGAVAAEADRAWRVVESRYRVGTADDAMALADIQREREDLGWSVSKGLLSRAQVEARLEELAREESRLSATRWLVRVRVPPMVVAEDGVGPSAPERVNAWLRRLFDHVAVDLGSEGVGRGAAPALAFEWRERGDSAAA